MKTVRLRCFICKLEFDKLAREFRRRRRLGHRLFFCTGSCRAIYQNRYVPRDRSKAVLNLRPGNRLDELTPFRWFLARVKQRSPGRRTSLTLEYLAALWDSQKGRCPLTGWRLDLPPTTNGWPGGIPPAGASLDRKNSEQGYIEGNVRFVSAMANFAKWTWEDSDVISFARSVAAFNKSKVSR